MILDAIGLTLPYAMAIALSPLPIIAAILTLGSPSGRAAGLAFTLGWMLGVALLAILMGLLMSKLGDTGQEGGPLVSWLRIIVGLLLLAAAARQFQTRPKDGENPPPPKWLAGFSNIAPAGAFRLGATLAGTNPKNIGLAIAAMSYLTYAAATATDLVVSIAVFVLLGSSSVLAIMLIHLLGGESGARTLVSAERYMVKNNKVIVMVIFLILGASVLGNGLAGLTP